MKSKITKVQWNKYILDLYFGTNNPLENCINRAYRDFNRTLHGFTSLKHNEEITINVKKHLFSEFEKVKTISIKTQMDFDAWHKNQCEILNDLYAKNNYYSFHIGQAQKWLNMIFKYIFSYGNKYLNGYDKIYQFCHVPLDNILINELKTFDPPKLATSWSRINKYETYIEYQDWFRRKFNDLPLDVEFKLWLGEGRKKMYEAKVIGLGDYYKNGDERIEFHIRKKDNLDFPHEYNKRLNMKMMFKNDLYYGGIRSTEGNDYIWICPDLKDKNKKLIKLSDIIKKYGLVKNQSINLEIVLKDDIEVKVIY